MNKTSLRGACAAVFISTLAGCGSSPSEADVRAALIKQADASGGLLAQSYKDAFAKVKLVGCAKADAGGYKCDISNAAGGVVSLRFVKADGAWAAVNER